jgi:transcriptional regulator with XRE-family HTH domain
LPTCKLTFQAKRPDFKPYPKQLKTIGDHLKKQWLDLNIPQKEVAKHLQATVYTVRNWEKNRSNPSLPFIPKIIQFLGYVPYDTQTQDFGKKIATSRRLLGLSQKDLARLIGVDPCTIRSWEKSKHRPQHFKILLQIDTLFPCL